GNNPQNQVAQPGQGAVEATGPQISANGRYIAYANNSNNLLSSTLPSNQNGRDNVYLYDAQSQTNILVSHNGTLTSGVALTPDLGGGTAPSTSSDGRYITFMDQAYPSKPTNLSGAITSGNVTGASNTADIVIQTSSTTIQALRTGDKVLISNVAG